MNSLNSIYAKKTQQNFLQKRISLIFNIQQIIITGLFMNENNKIKYLNKQIQKILFIFPKEYYTHLGQISLIYYMLKQYFTKIKREILKKNEYMSNYIFSDIRSHGRNLIHKYSISRIEEEFRNWLSLDPSNRSRNLIIASGDDTKSGRKYGRKI